MALTIGTYMKKKQKWREIQSQQKVETCMRCLDKDKKLAMKESKLTTIQEESSKLHRKIATVELSMGVKNAEKFPDVENDDGVSESSLMSKDKIEVVAVAIRYHRDWLYAASLYIGTRSEAQRLSAEVDRLQEVVKGLKHKMELMEVLYLDKLVRGRDSDNAPTGRKSK